MEETVTDEVIINKTPVKGADERKFHLKWMKKLFLRCREKIKK